MEEKERSLKKTINYYVKLELNEIKLYYFNALMSYSETFSRNMVIECIHIIES